VVNRVRQRLIAWMATPEALPTPPLPSTATLAAAAE
jgi:hypothetical protein